MRPVTFCSVTCFLIYFSFFLQFNLCKTQSVRYPRLNVDSCPHNFHCVTISSCNAALQNIKKGKNPTVCGWTSEVPLVCCPDDSGISPKHRKTISHLSPKGCGLKEMPYLKEDDTVVYPSDTPVYTEIEPRIEKRRRREATELGGTSDIPIHVFFAIGGVTAPTRWPWMVAIFNGNARRQLCGGTLIDERHIITAAHCFAGRSLDPSLYSVQIGEIFLGEENANYGVKDIKLHEGYQARYYYDDIAIMRLTNPLPNFTAACLPAQDDIHQGDNVTVLGWGDLSYGGPSSTRLQEVVNIPIVGNSNCDSKFRTLPGAPFPRGITNNFLCAGLEEGGKDACQGDSGGPLLLQHPEGSWSLVGVVSFGYKCGEPGYPGVYTKVSSYLKWIEKYIGTQNEVVTAKQSRSQNFEYIDDKPLWRSLPEKVLFPR